MNNNNNNNEVKIPLTKKQKLKLKHNNLIIIIGVLVLIFGGLFLFNTTDKKELNENKENNTNKNDNINIDYDSDKINIIDVNSKTRPYAIMINNVSTARPLQSGLQDAFIIYEIIVEGGITRYLALFQDVNTERIGSIRSARHYYLDYALENDAIYVHHGNSPQAKNDFSTLNIDRIEISTPKTGWRDKTLNVASEHTLFTSIDLLKKGLGKKRVERNKDLLLDYSSDEINLNDMEGSQIADNVKITYSNNTTSSYKYNADEKVYYRFVNNKEHVDYVTKKQYTFKNIITYQVKNYTLDDVENKGRQGLENIGSGEGYFITNGSAVKINWKKDCRECQTKYTYLNGKEIRVNDGNTFIQIQPLSKELVIE